MRRYDTQQVRISAKKEKKKRAINAVQSRLPISNETQAYNSTGSISQRWNVEGLTRSECTFSYLQLQLARDLFSLLPWTPPGSLPVMTADVPTGFPVLSWYKKIKKTKVWNIIVIGDSSVYMLQKSMTVIEKQIKSRVHINTGTPIHDSNNEPHS